MVAVATALAVANAVGNLFGASSRRKAERRKQRLIDETMNRILPVQQEQFDYRYNLTNALNNILLGQDAGRFNEVGGAEVVLRGNIGDESIKRFDEQAGAVDTQVAQNRADANTLVDELGSALTSARGYTDAERARQRGIQATADSAGSALIPKLGAAADATRRQAKAGDRLALAASAIGPAAVDGYAPQTHQRVVSEFAKRGLETQADVTANASAAADVGAYGDSRSEADSTLAGFNSVVDALRAKAVASSAALTPELAATGVSARNASQRFDGKSAITNLVASGTRDIADRYRSGRIAAISDAGSADINSLSDTFTKARDAYKTGMGGQVNASERYADLFTNLMREKAARIAGQSVGSNSWDSLSSVLNLASNFNFGGGSKDASGNKTYLPAGAL